jgi:hypothetical protein
MGSPVAVLNRNVILATLFLSIGLSYDVYAVNGSNILNHCRADRAGNDIEVMDTLSSLSSNSSHLVGRQ